MLRLALQWLTPGSDAVPQLVSNTRCLLSAAEVAQELIKVESVDKTLQSTLPCCRLHLSAVLLLQLGMKFSSSVCAIIIIISASKSFSKPLSSSVRSTSTFISRICTLPRVVSRLCRAGADLPSASCVGGTPLNVGSDPAKVRGTAEALAVTVESDLVVPLRLLASGWRKLLLTDEAGGSNCVTHTQ